MQYFVDASITESDVLQALDDIGHDPRADEVADILAKLDTASINASQDRSQALRDAVSSVLHEVDQPRPITIHLPKRPESRAVAEIYATYPRNPIDSRQVVMVTEINGSEEALALINAYPDIDGGIHLSELITLEPRKGFATAALKIILDTADRHNESVHLVAKKIGTNKTMLST
ncbi:hypothetical protein, partial [Ralstonia sp. ASV6]|uniref:hypothetical protein n=1 Tax=Ralstonia sp. ASV6 TaxID=2795124 RepID=UPI0018EC6E10